MTNEEERWAEALTVERLYGIAAPRFVAERIGELALGGDLAGVARWQHIAERLSALANIAGQRGS